MALSTPAPTPNRGLGACRGGRSRPQRGVESGRSTASPAGPARDPPVAASGARGSPAEQSHALRTATGSLSSNHPADYRDSIPGAQPSGERGNYQIIGHQKKLPPSPSSWLTLGHQSFSFFLSYFFLPLWKKKRRNPV